MSRQETVPRYADHSHYDHRQILAILKLDDAALAADSRFDGGWRSEIRLFPNYKHFSCCSAFADTGSKTEATRKHEGSSATGGGMSNAVRQSTCRVCGEVVRPGGGVVLEVGAGGRVHKETCLAIAQHSVPRRDLRPGGTYLPSSPESQLGAGLNLSGSYCEE
jgi:hypothetical protein